MRSLSTDASGTRRTALPARLPEGLCVAEHREVSVNRILRELRGTRRASMHYEAVIASEALP